MWYFPSPSGVTGLFKWGAMFRDNGLRILSEQTDNLVFGMDLGIEGMRSQKFSVGIFIFLIISLILFCYIIYVYLPKGRFSGLKTGEKYMFGAIVGGVILAVVIGWLQLIEGYLM